MNKVDFNKLREQYISVIPKIGGSLKSIYFRVEGEGNAFNTIEMARNAVGRIKFTTIFMEKEFPNYFYQIGEPGYLNQREINAVGKLLPKYSSRG